jgi:GNAT superfamily N-acetyltransferase
MGQSYSVVLVATPDPADVRAVRDGLDAYNRARVSDDTYRRLTLILRDPDATVVGGLLGGTYWGWLYVEILWVAEHVRGAGHGRALLAAAEQEAVRRGCHHAHLDTMSFQSRSFYERQGYTVFGELRDIPAGHQRYFMQKALA